MSGPWLDTESPYIARYGYAVPRRRYGPPSRIPRGLKKYQVAGAGVAGIASMAAKQALRWYGQPRRTKTSVKSGYRPRRGRVPRKKRTLKKQVQELKRVAEADTGTHIYRHRGSTIRTASVASMGITSLTGCSTASIEAALAGLRYYNPAVPGTLTTADGTSGTFHKEFYIKRQYSRYLGVNNYQIPCMVTLYVVQTKEDTSISPATAFTNGLTDVGNPTATSPLVYLTDSVQFNDLWKIVKSKRAVLQPGDSISLSFAAKPYSYDPSLVDSHTSAYQSALGCHTLVVRIEGVLGHDSVASEYGSLQAAIDLQEDRVFEINYPAGADIKTIVVNDTSSASFTNVGVVSNKPVSDNQSYSVA